MGSRGGCEGPGAGSAVLLPLLQTGQGHECGVALLPGSSRLTLAGQGLRAGVQGPGSRPRLASQCGQLGAGLAPFVCALCSLRPALTLRQGNCSALRVSVSVPCPRPPSTHGPFFTLSILPPKAVYAGRPPPPPARSALSVHPPCTRGPSSLTASRSRCARPFLVLRGREALGLCWSWGRGSHASRVTDPGCHWASHVSPVS